MRTKARHPPYKEQEVGRCLSTWFTAARPFLLSISFHYSSQLVYFAAAAFHPLNFFLSSKIIKIFRCNVWAEHARGICLLSIWPLSRSSRHIHLSLLRNLDPPCLPTQPHADMVFHCTGSRRNHGGHWVCGEDTIISAVPKLDSRTLHYPSHVASHCPGTIRGEHIHDFRTDCLGSGWRKTLPHQKEMVNENLCCGRCCVFLGVVWRFVVRPGPLISFRNS